MAISRHEKALISAAAATLALVNVLYLVMSVKPIVLIRPQEVLMPSLYRLITLVIVAALSGYIGSSLVILSELLIVFIPYLTLTKPDVHDIALTLIIYITITTCVRRKFGRGVSGVNAINSSISSLNEKPIGSLASILMICGLSLILAAALWPLILRFRLGVNLLILLSLGIPINSLLIHTLCESRGTYGAHILGSIISSLGIISLPTVLAIASITPVTEVTGVSLGKGEIVLGDIKSVLKKGAGNYLKITRRYVKKKLIINLNKLLNKHMLIIGKSGSGKSYLAKKVIRQLLKDPNINVMVIDPHGEYADELGNYFIVLDVSSVSINPLELMGKSPKERAYEISELLTDIFNLGQVQKYHLMNTILSAYVEKGFKVDEPSTWSKEPPSFSDVLMLIKESKGEGVDVRIQSLLPYIDILSSRVFSETSISINRVIHNPTIIDLHKSVAESIEVIFVDTLLRMLYNRVMELKGLGKDIFIIIEEAHRFMKGRGFSIINKLLKEGRKYGINLILITQQPLDLSPDAYTNSDVKVVFALDEQRNLSYVSNVLSPYQNARSVNVVRGVIKQLSRGEAIVRLGAIDELYVIKT